MPKRNNPFGDSSCLQLKTHIGTKEVDKGVDQQNRMKSVYERTRKLLFDGVQKEVGDVGDNNNCALWKSQEDETIMKSDNLKQMHLNKYCQLVEEEECEMDTDDGNKMENDDAFHINERLLQRFHSSSSKHNDIACHSFPLPNKHVDLRFTQNESKATDFVSASSLLTMTKSPKPLSPNGNVFEQMKQAQTVMSRYENTSGACHSCRQPVHTRDVMKCQFCENFICGKCSRQCSGCHLHFCPLCSILNYTEAVERAFCFTCNG